MKPMDCTQLSEAAPELALGILPGDERAAALAHLDDCPRCRREVNSLAGLADQLSLLAPRTEPPAGFEERVLASLPRSPTVLRPERRRRTTRAAVAVLALAACIALALVVRWGGSSSAPAFAAEQMRTPNGTVVGQVLVHREQPHALLMSLPGWEEHVTSYGQAGETYSLRIERRDGPAQVVPVTMDSDASWASTLDFDAATITSVAMVDSQGRVVCRAEFGPAA
jgi:hypothetical protein